MNPDLMSKIISLCKRRGFVFPSSEIYGGFSSSYDFGPLGVELKNNIKQNWWKAMRHHQKEIVGLDSSILMSPRVWQASGHLTSGFADNLKECQSCHKRFRSDEVQNNKCPNCNHKLSKSKKFNLMMKTFIGPIENKAFPIYLRAETCQGIYINFKNVLQSMSLKIPFGIAQIGKSFRNEITPKNFIFKTREFEQMEMQWFCHPDEADKFFDYWTKERIMWYINLGIDKKKLKIKEITKKDRAHYAKRQVDIYYLFPFGWQEIEGIHNRTNWDLSNHNQHSQQDLSYYNQKTKQKYIPYIIETSAGVERVFLTFICNAYQEIQGGRTKTTKAVKDKEIVLRLDKKISPIKVAVLPLVKNKIELIEKAKKIYFSLKPYFAVQYNEKDAIGRRYRKQDEIGTPFCLTIDFQTIDDDTVTIRERDTMKQKRIKIKNVIQFLNENL